MAIVDAFCGIIPRAVFRLGSKIRQQESATPSAYRFSYHADGRERPI